MSANVPGTDTSAEMVPIPRSAAGGALRAKQGASGNEIEFITETATAAMAERARANVEARFIMARRFPRDLDVGRVKLKAACARPRFAEKAIYSLPRGDKSVEGPTIRMLEECARCLGNIDTEPVTLVDDVMKRIVEVSATDLESNLTHRATVVIEKTVERRDTTGRVVRGQRVNSNGDTVYIVSATDDEIQAKANALISKALRTCLTRIVPHDLLAEGMRTAYETIDNENAKDPDAVKKSIIDNFWSIGVRPEQLVELLGHSLEALTPKEMTHLRMLYTGIRSGEATWEEAVETAHRLAEEKARKKEGTEATAKPAGAKPAGSPAAPPAGPAQPSKPSSLGEAAARTREQRQAAPAGQRKGVTIVDEAGNAIPISGPPAQPQSSAAAPATAAEPAAPTASAPPDAPELLPTWANAPEDGPEPGSDG